MLLLIRGEQERWRADVDDRDASYARKILMMESGVQSIGSVTERLYKLNNHSGEPIHDVVLVVDGLRIQRGSVHHSNDVIIPVGTGDAPRNVCIEFVDATGIAWSRAVGADRPKKLRRA